MSDCDFNCDGMPNQEDIPSREDILLALHDELTAEEEEQHLSGHDLYTILEFVRYMKYLGGGCQFHN